MPAPNATILLKYLQSHIKWWNLRVYHIKKVCIAFSCTKCHLITKLYYTLATNINMMNNKWKISPIQIVSRRNLLRDLTSPFPGQKSLFLSFCCTISGSFRGPCWQFSQEESALPQSTSGEWLLSSQISLAMHVTHSSIPDGVPLFTELVIRKTGTFFSTQPLYSGFSMV